MQGLPLGGKGRNYAIRSYSSGAYLKVMRHGIPRNNSVMERLEDIEVINLITYNNTATVRLKSNGGAKISVMNDASILYDVTNIPDYYIGGIGSGIK